MSGDMNALIDKMRRDPPHPIPEGLSNLEGMVGCAFEHAKAVLVGAPKTTQLMPAWLVLTSKGQITIVATPFEDEAQKNVVAAQMRHFMREVGAIRYSMTSEAWLAHQPKGQPFDGRPVGERDDRIEVVMVLACDRSGSAMASYEIKRDRQSGQVVELTPMDDTLATSKPGESVGGRFCDLLED